MINLNKRDIKRLKEYDGDDKIISSIELKKILEKQESIEKERDRFKCQICDSRATIVVFYHKYYPTEKLSSYEEPALICTTCDNKILLGEGNLDKIPTCYKIMRGGIENIHRLTVDFLVSLTVKELAINYFNKGFIRNDLRQKSWRKTILRLRYIYLPSKKKRNKIC